MLTFDKKPAWADLPPEVVAIVKGANGWWFATTVRELESLMERGDYSWAGTDRGTLELRPAPDPFEPDWSKHGDRAEKLQVRIRTIYSDESSLETVAHTYTRPAPQPDPAAAHIEALKALGWSVRDGVLIAPEGGAK